jgi:hypothetical protein
MNINKEEIQKFIEKVNDSESVIFDKPKFQFIKKTYRSIFKGIERIQHFDKTVFTLQYKPNSNSDWIDVGNMNEIPVIDMGIINKPQFKG